MRYLLQEYTPKDGGPKKVLVNQMTQGTEEVIFTNEERALLDKGQIVTIDRDTYTDRFVDMEHAGRQALNAEYEVHLSRLVPGDKIVVEDDGFTCMEKGDVVVVREGVSGLYVECDDGKHFLDGQMRGWYPRDDVLVGFTREKDHEGMVAEPV